MAESRKIVVWAAVASVAVLVGIGIGAWLIARARAAQTGGVEAQERADEREGEELDTLVKAIRPKRDPSLVISVQQLLSIEPFFEADLRAQVAGVVRFVQKDIGDRVKRGETLIALDVPHLEQELLQKEAIVLQRKSDVKLALRQVENAQAFVEVAKETIAQRKSEVGQAEATRDYRKKRWDRFVVLAKGQGVQQNLVDEEERDYKAAWFAAQGAEAVVRKASADYREKESAVRMAEADVQLKESLVEVAVKDRDRAQAMLDYAQITAPFDGEVVRRKVDVGTFVQNASTGLSEPLLTIARTDIVTAVMKVPDNAAPFVTRDTEAILQIDELPGVLIRGKVTRFSPSIRSKDRTMRVEVDLYNDKPARYAKFRARTVGAWLAGMAGNNPLAVAELMAGSRLVWSRDSRSKTDPFPMMASASNRDLAPKLIPGMSGYMRLNLKQFRDAFLLPSSAVFTRGGKPYILEVKNGVTQLVPVRVQVSDGKLTKVAVLIQEAVPTRGQPEVLRDLTGEEIIVLNRQTEIGEGQAVQVSIEKW